MADIFSDIVKGVGATLKQTITPDTLRDYQHASRLFVGGPGAGPDQYRLAPKSGFLFHVFFDVNTQARKVDTTNPNALKEIGLMVKSVDLPKFSFDIKTYNAYNRPNIVQTKIKYDPVSVVFHDDSNNLIRNFWRDYFSYYYRDTDYNLNQYKIPYKYEQTRFTEFGYTPRNVASNQPYLDSIRIYSLYRKKFSEYILVNPIIKSFRHGNHSYESADTMSHDMSIEYESVIYNAGSTRETIKGFADLHYDRTPSPITPAGGGPKTLFGEGGIVDTAKGVLDDLQEGNYGRALFNTARGIRNAKNMNLKAAALAEVNSAFTKAIQDSVTTTSIRVPDFITSGTVQNVELKGLSASSSIIALAAGGVLLSQSRTPKPINGARIREINQATTVGAGKPLTNYVKTFPPLPNSTPTTSVPGSLLTINDQNTQTPASNQQTLNIPTQRLAIDNKISSVTQNITRLSDEINTANTQVLNATAAYNAVNSKIVAAQSLPSTNPNRQILLNQYQQELNLMSQIITDATELKNQRTSELNTLSQQLNALKAERNLLLL